MGWDVQAGVAAERALRGGNLSLGVRGGAPALDGATRSDACRVIQAFQLCRRLTTPLATCFSARAARRLKQPAAASGPLLQLSIVRRAKSQELARRTQGSEHRDGAANRHAILDCELSSSTRARERPMEIRSAALAHGNGQ